MFAIQPGILAPVPRQARYLTFALWPGKKASEALRRLAAVADGERVVVGLGEATLQRLNRQVPGMRSFPARVAHGIEIPATHGALWCWLRDDDRGAMTLRSRELAELLAPAFELMQVIDAFRFGSGLDLTGYEDGTENPKGRKAQRVGFVVGQGEGLDGGSFVAVQQWRHDLARFRAMKPEQQDQMIGRRRSDNEELDDAPPSAHVKRTAQESFSPEAFVLRRSMPWADAQAEGLVFTAFGHSFDAYEALLGRMIGLEDGITDALFQMSRPLTGSFFWCPPVRDGRLDLRALGIA
jgi:putative iron-dependent peroxidase